jgi:hypothetical protein
MWSNSTFIRGQLLMTNHYRHQKAYILGEKGKPQGFRFKEDVLVKL